MTRSKAYNYYQFRRSLYILRLTRLMQKGGDSIQLQALLVLLFNALLVHLGTVGPSIQCTVGPSTQAVINFAGRFTSCG